MDNHPALIYCRVSSTKQVREGHGLSSQETRCREYAKLKGYEVIEVFNDEGVSGSLIARPGMHALLDCIRSMKACEPVVLIDDVSRLARGLEAHIQLRMAISKAGGKLESPSIEFGDDSDSQLIENLLASVSQHQRQKNAEQVVNRMRARVMNGYWVNGPVFGYRYEKVPGHGKMMVRKEPLATIIQDALEGFASGRLDSQVAVQEFFERHPSFPRGGTGRVHLQRVKEILKRVFYAGYISLPNWDIHLVQGKHEPLISFDTYKKIQERLEGKAKAPPRINSIEEFPLRGFVNCCGCDQPMTSYSAQGRSKKYPYYYCHRKECSEYGKSVRREKIEAEFEGILKDLIPAKTTLMMFIAVGQTWWEQQSKRLDIDVKEAISQIRAIDTQINQFLTRIVETRNDRLVQTYETKINALEEDKIRLREMTAKKREIPKSFADSFRTVIPFLSNPYKLWVSREYECKKLVLKLAFGGKLSYHLQEGFRTAPIARPFRVLSDLQEGKYEVVEGAGFEPT